MLGSTAGGLFWMFRYLERCENTARLVDAGFRIALTRSSDAEDEWQSVTTTSGSNQQEFLERYESFDGINVIDFLLRDKQNSSSVAAMIHAARENARRVRSALTREVWEATNDCWMTLNTALAKPIPYSELPKILNLIGRQTAVVRGALHGTMLRNDIYYFSRLGTFLERADNTARILDIKYYVLLPSARFVGSSLDNVQWEIILRSLSALRSYRWLYKGEASPKQIADFLIMDRRLPRSLAFSYENILRMLEKLSLEYATEVPSLELARKIHDDLLGDNMDHIFGQGLHQFLAQFLQSNADLGMHIQQDYRFNG